MRSSPLSAHIHEPANHKTGYKPSIVYLATAKQLDDKVLKCKENGDMIVAAN